MRHGYFDTERDEYVIDRVDTPASWTNYLGVNDYCAILNQTGGGYSFYRSAERGRVTRFRANGLPQDYPGHWLYLRDDDDGDYWSATWQPIGKPLDQARHRVRHGLSYSVFECRYADIEVSQRVLVPLGDPVELWDVTVTNRSERPRRLSLFGYVEFSFHSIQIDNQNLQMSLYAAGSSQAAGVIEYDFHYEPWTYHYFAGPPNLAGFDCRREAFVGDYRSEANPVAVERGACSGSAGTTGNHCGGLQHRVELASGESRRLVYLLGHGDRAAGITARAKYTPEGVDQAAAQLRAYWADKQSRLKVATPSWAMTALTNAWTLLQLETCVVWSRFASFVEVGGRTGLGYRDTAQDAMAAAHSHPDKVRQRLWELLRGQMSAGYGLHLFDPLLFQENRRPEAPAGVRLPTVLPESAADQLHGLQDACSDDHLWLVGAVVAYLKETGDLAFLDQVVPFADSDPEGDSGS
ncbi:MAG: hypothetical protein LBK42_09210, partial [Propionibacteriaceae bacterium]|nr:hypothetical protein [Propionibacteriaceae bacterium]